MSVYSVVQKKSVVVETLANDDSYFDEKHFDEKNSGQKHVI